MPRSRGAAVATARPRSTSAPAPSPNSTQVPRSSQSRMREKVSAPITSAVRACPLRSTLSATASAKMKPAHTACTSKAAPRVMPSRACTLVAVAGKVLSGVAVASTMQIEIAAVHPGRGQRALAPRAAPDRRSARRGAATWRSPMPVRCTDPLIGGVEPLGQLGIGDDALGQIGAAADDLGSANSSQSAADCGLSARRWHRVEARQRRRGSCRGSR